jgi:cytoskeletal protein RodZ
MELIGAKLKKIRLEKGLTLEDAQKKTKIQLKLLKAIEDGSTANVNLVYLKSFIKIYCNFLGIDYRDYLPEYRDPLAVLRRSRAPQPPPAQTGQAKPVSFIQSASSKMSAPRTLISVSTLAGIGVALLIVVGLFVLGKAILSKRSGPPRVAAASAAQSKTARRQQASKTKKTSVDTPVVKPQIIIPTTASSTQGVRLTLSAREDVWVKIKSDGKLLYYGILKKGRFDTWQARERITLNVGNAGVVDLNVNGQVISSIGRRGQIINDIVITKEGLSVP